MGDNENDYDRIAVKIGEAFAVLVGNAHEPAIGNDTDSITMTEDQPAASRRASALADRRAFPRL